MFKGISDDKICVVEFSIPQINKKTHPIINTLLLSGKSVLMKKNTTTNFILKTYDGTTIDQLEDYTFVNEDTMLIFDRYDRSSASGRPVF